MTFTTINPTTEEVLAEYPEMSASDIEDILRETDTAFEAWRRVPIGDRTDLLRALAAKLRERESEYADLMCREMGKPLAEGAAEVQKCAWACDYYADNAADFAPSMRGCLERFASAGRISDRGRSDFVPIEVEKL